MNKIIIIIFQQNYQNNNLFFKGPVVAGPIADCTEKIFNLNHLSEEDSTNLFLLRAPRPINQEEI